MASDKNFVEFVVDQIEKAGVITCRSMFGEYGIYSDGKIFGLICDNSVHRSGANRGQCILSQLHQQIERAIITALDQ